MTAAPSTVATGAETLRAELARITRQVWPVLLAGTLAGVAFVVLVPAGLPYDEPAHWLNVQFYLGHGRMPTLGEPGTSYEAQMGPFAYVLYALVAAPFHLLGADTAAFYAARALGIAQLLVLALLLAAVARRTVAIRPGVAIVATAAAVLNPMLLAVSTSVQNDTLALACGSAALLAVVERRPRPMHTAALAGLLLGLALLTKVTAWPFVVALGVLLLWQRRVRELLVMALVTAVVSGWWFVRNLVLYGDVTARAGVEAAGYDFPALPDASPMALAKSAVTYLWLPTEYVRNVIAAPAVIDVLVAALTLAVAAGVVLMLRYRATRSPMPLLVIGTAMAAIAAWAAVAAVAQAVAFRTAYPAMLLVHAAWGACAFVGTRRALVLAVVPLVTIDLWFLAHMVGLDVESMLVG
ncbi:glycosyltransferase 87 family protein [Demequina aestuarii]|uniref:glycosyltransferase 87 family protein n=1 Tax=Demequina aestuarii TaxID=327095 RepID=UPI00078226BA|nr:glycosyltransferase 87 family protein [Demequina aestuarii]